MTRVGTELNTARMGGGKVEQILKSLNDYLVIC